jgi:hypothetical protein
MLLHNDYLIKMLTNRVDEFWNKDYQCVAFNKDHAREVWWIPLWSFNWYAIKATHKIWGTYDPRYIDKFSPWPTVWLKQWDHIIQEFWKTWHIWVVHRADANGYYLIEQNNGELDKSNWFIRGNGDWLWNDAVLIRYYKWNTRPIKNIYRKK